MRALHRSAAPFACLVLLAACGDEQDVLDPPGSTVAATGAQSGTGASGPTSSPASSGAGGAGGAGAGGTSGAGGAAMQDCTAEGEVTPPPMGAASLEPWLAAGSYKGWPSQSVTHSFNTHFGQVKVFINPILCESLNAGAAAHPQGAAAVKELFGQAPEMPPQGWSVSHKTQADSAGGQSWYWYEKINTSKFADGLGTPLCVNCHGTGKDYYRSEFPLQ
jgi:hypothetical protein